MVLSHAFDYPGGLLGDEADYSVCGEGGAREVGCWCAAGGGGGGGTGGREQVAGLEGGMAAGRGGVVVDWRLREGIR